MTLLLWIFFLVVGRIIIHVWQQFHLPRFLKKYEWLKKLHECDLCSGVWIYAILSFFTEIDLLEVAGLGYIPLVGAIITGIIVSWGVHIWILGWKSKYEVIVI